MFSSLNPIVACFVVCQILQFDPPNNPLVADESVEAVLFNSELDTVICPRVDFDNGFVDEKGEDWNNGDSEFARRLQPGAISLNGTSASGTERITGGNRWTKVNYQSLDFGVQLPQGTNPDAIRFWLNGLPADPEMLTLQSDWSTADPRNVTATYQWLCPPLGKIVLQVEYLVGDVWSPLSRPLRLEVMPPSIPRPIAAGASETGLVPLSFQGQTVDCLNQILVKFANVAPGASVVADIDGYGHIQGEDRSNCCYSFDLKTLLTVGRYKMTFRQADAKHCGLSSHASSSISIELSFDPNVEVTIDNIKSSRRLAMLKHAEGLMRETNSQEIEWMRELMREPCPPFKFSKNSDVESNESYPGSVVPEDVTHSKPSTAQENEPIIPTPFSTPDSVLPPPLSKGGSTETSNELATPVRPQAESKKDFKKNGKLILKNHDAAQQTIETEIPLRDCNRPELSVSLKEQQEIWNARSQQARELFQYLEFIESSQDSIMNSFKTSKLVSKIDFDTPTVFASSRRAYSVDGAVAGDLTILEGMRISAAANGNYRVEFKYIAPLTPAIVHLQIQFRSDHISGWKTLTLAPIAVKSIDYDEPETMVHQVVREGYSAALERVGGYIDQVRRRGSAVSGYNLSGTTETFRF